MENIAIVITAYNRARALQKLFKSLDSIRTNIDLPLVISIDNHGTKEVIEVCENYKWKFGEKEIIIHQEKLGLKNHFIWAGNQTNKYENVLFLEDDLAVSPEIINYAIQSIEFYKDEDRVAGISCYNPIYTLSHLRFYQTQDGYDNYFLQHPYWGNIWSRNKWEKFKQYLETYNENITLLPNSAKNWNRSFKKIFMQFLVETGRTIVIPRISLVTNNGIGGGEHNRTDDSRYHVEFLLQFNRQYHFSTIDQSMSMYDAFEEIDSDILKKENDILKEYDFEVDLTGNKCTFVKPYVLTNRNVKNQIMSFSGHFKPSEIGIINNISGGDIRLAKSEDVCIESFKNVLVSDFEKNTINTNPIVLLKLFLKSLSASLKARL